MSVTKTMHVHVIILLMEEKMRGVGKLMGEILVDMFVGVDLFSMKIPCDTYIIHSQGRFLINLFPCSVYVHVCPFLQLYCLFHRSS